MPPAYEYSPVTKAGSIYNKLRARRPIAVASANWLALGAFTAELIGDGVLIDIGSTTTDIIPITNGEVRCLGRDDASRLSWEELVYTGIVRTPVISVCSSVPLRGRRQPLVAEVFATMSDVYRLLGNISERPRPHADRGWARQGSR